MIRRVLVAETLGLPADTDALPPGDLPLNRFAERLIGYLSTPEADAETPDAWTGAVMDRLIAEDPQLALAVIQAGAALPDAEVLADPLAELGESDAAMRNRIEDQAEEDGDLAALIATLDR